MNFSIRSLTAAASVLLLISAGPAGAQRLYFANGADVDWSEVTLSGSNIQKKIRQADGRDGYASIPASNVARVDWPFPAELADAGEALSRGNYDEALKNAEAVRAIHRNWKDKPGSWYVPATLIALECHIRKNNNAEADKIFPELRNMQLSSDYQKGAGMMEALQQFQKGMTGPALQKANTLLAGTENSAVLARLYNLIGDIQFKREAYKEALDAYLQIPVFFGTQASLLPGAEFGAARSLMRLRRLEDANVALDRILQRYKGTWVEAAARKEKEDLEKVIGAGGAEAGGKEAGEKPAEGAAPQKTE
jgi:tetratricopeptide (TPR) repeat protein